MPADKKSKARTKSTAKATTKGKRSSAATSPVSLVGRYRQRIGALFADIERLAANPACMAPEIQSELESLRARLCELEAQISQSDKESVPQVAEDQAISPVQTSKGLRGQILYERDRIGYIYTDDRLQEVRDTGALTGITPEITAPLTADGQSVGAVELSSPVERPVTKEEEEVVNTVAQQVSLQIQSLRLLAETERARAEAEAATRRFMHEAWDTYLDAIHQNEQIGFAYDQSAVKPFLEKADGDSSVRESVDILDEQIGTLYLKPDPEHPLGMDEREMVSAVANQIAQQVENIRLLADAARARAEADDVIKRITQESWDSFVAQKEEKSLGFIYDTNRVKPLKGKIPKNMALDLPLQVRGESIGRLAITGSAEISPEAADLAAAIAVQTSNHLETLRLTEELQKRAAELLELDRLKSGFLANMSHELRTPLNSILGFTDVILEELDGPLTPNMSTDLQLIQKNGQHLLHLINDVLDMAKITAGRMNLDLEKFNIYEILEEVVSITSTLASEKNLASFVDANSNAQMEIFADRTRIRQVMLNLVNNAIKFTEKGQIALRVDKQDDEHILIAVQDTGIGIPSEELDLIFQEFTQVDTSSTRKAGGTGLGLPISRKLIEMHGGRMWAESTGVSGEGSTFYVEMPIEAKFNEPIEQQEK